MSHEGLMRQFAALVGGAIARRWLRQRGLIPPLEGDRGPRATTEEATDSASPPSRAPAAGDGD
jgi:hypothetical protein